jgi:hypothetical protein
MIEGQIKFKCKLVETKPPLPEKIKELNFWRNRLYSLGLIGYKKGFSIGNISERIKGKKFIITGFKTGKIKSNQYNFSKMANPFNIFLSPFLCKQESSCLYFLSGFPLSWE